MLIFPMFKVNVVRERFGVGQKQGPRVYLDPSSRPLLIDCLSNTDDREMIN